MQELHTATDFALRATKVTARSLGKAMSTMVVQERYLWLNLAEMKDVEKACPHLPGGADRRNRRGLCPAVLGDAEVDRGEPAHPAPAWGTGLHLLVAVDALLHPPELLRPMLKRGRTRCLLCHWSQWMANPGGVPPAPPTVRLGVAV